MDMFCDNKAAIAIAHNPIWYNRTKHVEIDKHFIKKNSEAKIIWFPFVRSKNQLADIFTKAILSNNFYNSLHKLHIRDLDVWTQWF